MDDVNRVHRALAIIAEAAGRSRWVVGGSAGLLLRGLPLSPNDVDIYCDEEDVASLHHALRGYAMDQPKYSATAIYRSRLAHYRMEGLKVELVGGFRVSALGCVYSVKVKEILLPFAKLVQLQTASQSVHVVPLAHELMFNVLRDRHDRIQPIMDMMNKDLPLHLPALEALERDNDITVPMRAQIRDMMDGRKAGEPIWKRK